MFMHILKKIWFSKLHCNVVYSTYPPNSILATQVLWIPVNVFPATKYRNTSLFELWREATLSGANGFLKATTKGISKVFYPPDPNKKERMKISPSPTLQKVRTLLEVCKKKKRKPKKGCIRTKLVLSTTTLDYKVITIYFNSSQGFPLS